jgi:LysM repeat protein
VSRYSGVAGFMLALAMLTGVIALAILTGVIPTGGGPAAIVTTPTPSFTPPESAIPTASPEPSPSPEPTVTSVLSPTPALSPGGTHVVQSGESLFTIGELYGVAWELIAQANDIQPPDYIVHVGDELIIPIPPEVTPGAPSYVVQSGDTITDIATKLRVDPTDLADYNNIEDWNTIYVGQILLIPGAASPSPSG